MQIEARHKMKVFISSRCGGNYTIARKALETLLLATGLMDVYVFENELACSLDTKSAYLDYVDCSDLCLVLVDNKDGVSEGVLAEIIRAKDKGVRLLYLFCDETEKAPTTLQKELKANFASRYLVVHEFSDIVRKAYESVIQDLITVYRHKDVIVKSEFNDSNIINSDAGKEFVISKDKITCFDTVKTRFFGLIGIGNDTCEECSNNFDNLALKYLSYVLRKEKYDYDSLISLRDEIVSRHNDSLKNIIQYRFIAISLYARGKIEEALSSLQKALGLAIDNNDVPEWIANDIAIDIRYMCSAINEMNSTFSIKNEGQVYIDKSSETVFYPVLDRKVCNFSERLNKYFIEHMNQSPYSTSFGGLNDMFYDLAESFCIALFYGSIVNTEIVRKRVVDALYTLTFLYNDYNLRLELLRLSICDCNDKIIDNFIRTYDSGNSVILNEDIECILNSIEIIPLEYRKYAAKFILVSSLGAYFNDDIYDSVSTELVTTSIEWAHSPSRIFNLAGYILKFYRNNLVRLENNSIVDFIDAIFHNKLKVWYSNCLDILACIDMSKFSTVLQRKVLDFLLDIIKNNNSEFILSSLKNAIVSFGKTTTVDKNELEDALQEKMLEFYKTTYSINVVVENDENRFIYIKRYLEEAHKRNCEQGKNGKYSGYGEIPYYTIRNILERDRLMLDDEQIGLIVDIALETLASTNQLTCDKLFATEFLLYLRLKYCEYSKWEDIKNKLISNSDEYAKGVEFAVWDKYSNSLLEFAYDTLLQICNNKFDTDSLVCIATIDKNDAFNIIRILKILETLLLAGKNYIVDKSFLLFVAYFVIDMSTHKEHDVKLYATKCLFSLIYYPVCNELISLQLFRLMDDSISDVKILIVNNLMDLDGLNREYKDYILQKANIDNNYYVRRIAEKNTL